MNRPGILIIDHCESDAEQISRILSGFDVDIIKAKSVEETHHLSESHEFAMALIDLGRDGKEGFKTLEDLRSHKKLSSLHVLLLSDNCCEYYSDYGIPYSGAVDFISRPIVPVILAGKIESILSQFLQRKRLEEELERRRVAEAELKEAKRVEEEAVTAKKQFLSTMSHEIRTPLNTIINTISMLITDHPREDQVEDMDVLKFSAENLLQLINDILDYSKIDSGNIEFEDVEFNIRNLVAGIQQSLHYGMVKKGINLEFKIDDDVPDFLIGDSVRLAQIFFNLIGNALKFTEKGRVLFKASVHGIMEDSAELKFAVSDTGIGIPKDKQKTIFEAFKQASASTTREYGGTGLGLAITKMLVEKQDGRIELKSRPGAGSTFSVYLKFRKSATRKKPVRTPGPEDIKSLEGLRILVVEDNLVNQKIVFRLLTKWNAVADVADNGKLAIAKVSRNHYELVLMDLHMPEMSGYEATIKIREMEGEYFKTVPILALTASAFAEDRKKICASGMDGYIIKPFHPAELNSKISRFMGRKIRA